MMLMSMGKLICCGSICASSACVPLPVEQCTGYTSGSAVLGVSDVIALLKDQEAKIRIHEYDSLEHRNVCQTSVALVNSLIPMTPLFKQHVRVSGTHLYTDSVNFHENGKEKFHAQWSYDGAELRSMEMQAKSGAIRKLTHEFTADILHWRDFYRPIPFVDMPSISNTIESVHAEHPERVHVGTALHPTRGKVLYLETAVSRIFLDPNMDYTLFANMVYPVLLTVKPYHPGMVASYGIECTEMAKAGGTWVPTKMLYTLGGKTVAETWERGRVDEITFTNYFVGKKRPIEDYRLKFPDWMPYYDAINNRSVAPRETGSLRWIWWTLIAGAAAAAVAFTMIRRKSK